MNVLMKKKGLKAVVVSLLICLLVMSSISVVHASESDTTAKLSSNDTGSLIPFSVENMFPGDSKTQDFVIEVSHSEAVTLYYHADIRPGYDILAEVLQMKVELPDKGMTLYDGLMRDMPNSLEYGLAANETSLTYRITVYLDTSVGNITELDTDGKRYMYQELVADFRWWYLEDDDDGDGGGDSSDPDHAVVKLAAEKILDNQYPRGNDFSFQLEDAEENVIQTVTNTDGLIEFDSMSFSASGTYIYYMTELEGTDSDIDYDETVYKITIDVSKVSGDYEAEVSYEKDGETYSLLPRFVNSTEDDSDGSGSGDSDDYDDSDSSDTDDPDDTNSTDPSDPDGSDPDDSEDSVIPVTPDNVKTGDDSNLGLYVTLLGISLAVLAILSFINRRKEDVQDE